MRLVIREYLSMLKESGELDALLADLLLCMGVVPTSKPQVGVRQHGVDIAGVGPDPDDQNTTKLFLLIIKRGDLDRATWNDPTPQSVRASLDEVLDVYLANCIGEEHRTRPKKIIVCCNGDMKQNAQPNWTGYTKKQQQPGLIEFEFWGADRLSMLIEQFFLDEYLFPDSAQKQLRKTIALADQNEREPVFFYQLVQETLFERGISTEATPKARRQRQHALRLVNLMLNIVFHWCQEADNLRPALLSAERTLLLAWDWIRKGKLFDCPKTNEELGKILATHGDVLTAFVLKLAPFRNVRDGLLGHSSAEELEYPLRTFEVIGILGVLGAILAELQLNEEQAELAQAVASLLASLIKNNPPATTPRFDSHAIDITLALLALEGAGQAEAASGWLEELGPRIMFGYHMGKCFPICSDDYNDLVAMEFGEPPPKEKLLQMSTLLPLVAHWYAILDLSDTYEEFQKAIKQTLGTTNLQIWFPDETSEDCLYRQNAGIGSGTMLSSIELPPTLKQLKEECILLNDERQEYRKLSCFEHGWRILSLIASRHFRTPVIPEFWLRKIQKSSSPTTNQIDEEAGNDEENLE